MLRSHPFHNHTVAKGLDGIKADSPRRKALYFTLSHSIQSNRSESDQNLTLNEPINDFSTPSVVSMRVHFTLILSALFSAVAILAQSSQGGAGGGGASAATTSTR